MTRRRCTQPTGLSLLEIIIAVGVLGGTAVVLAQMVDLGRRHAEGAAEIAAVQTVAQNVMHEIVIGDRPLLPMTTPQPVDPWSDWDVTIDVRDVGFGSLVEVSVALTPAAATNGNDVGDASAGITAEPKAEMPPATSSLGEASVDEPPTYRLTRWMRGSIATQSEMESDLESFEAFDSFSFD